MSLIFPIISQTVTNDSLICLPKKYLVEAIKDIEKGDECQQELYILKSNDSILNQQIELRDSIIYNYSIKENNYQKIISNNNDKIVLKDNKIESLIKDNKKYKIQRNIVGISSIIFITISLLI